MEKFTLAGGVATRYTDFGKGDITLVLLHGYLESLEIWEHFAGLLGKKYRVITLDLPGHGISETRGEIHTMEFLARVVEDLLAQLQVAHCFVIGHSLGGYVALEYAHKYPERLEGLILLHSTPNSDTPERQSDRKREIEIVRAGKKEILVTQNPQKGFAPGNRKKYDDTIEELAEQAQLTDDEGIIAMLNGLMSRPDQNETLRQLKVPSLLVFGRQDVYIPEEAALAIIEAHSEVEVVWLENSGHMGFIEEEGATLEAVEVFVDTHAHTSA